jgi:hypothetical protein
MSNRKKKADKAKLPAQSFFITACRQFAETTDECYPDHLLVLFGSEPPQDGKAVSVACSCPDHEKVGQVIQMISGIMTRNKEVCSMMIASVGHWIEEIFGPDKEQQYMDMIEGFMQELATKRRILAKEKEMSPNADGQ